MTPDHGGPEHSGSTDPQPVPDHEPDWVDLSSRKAGQGYHDSLRLRPARLRGFLTRLFDLDTEDRRRRLVASAERRVARELDHLPRGWHVLHSIPLDRAAGHLDHLIIGPPGVFLADSKLHPDAVVWLEGDILRVNGAPASDLDVVRRDAALAREALTAACGRPVPVSGIVIIVGGELRIRRMSGTVHVVTRKQLVLWLRRRPRTLQPDEVEHIYEHARRSTTWPDRSGGGD